MKNLFQVLICFMALGLLLMSMRVCADSPSDSLKATVSDSVITAKVKGQFVANENTKAASINVETNNGIVKLAGTVDSEIEASTAIQIAASTVGVKEVNTDDLTIKAEPEQNKRFVRDSYITAKIKGAMTREKLMNNIEFPAVSIKVETKNKIVYLSGTVENEDQLKKAIALAKSISGVKKVISKVTVSAG